MFYDGLFLPNMHTFFSLLEFENTCLISAAVEFTCYLYMPTAIDAHSNETMSFYDRLSSIVDAIPIRDLLFLCGDFNAALPVDKVRVKNRCGEANRNTKMLQSFIERHDLLAANACTRQKHRPLMDQIGVRLGLIGISALFVIDIISGNPIHLGHP